MKYNSTGLSLRLREQVSGEVIDGGLCAIYICKRGNVLSLFLIYYILNYNIMYLILELVISVAY